jgi:hypothetical protein
LESTSFHLLLPIVPAIHEVLALPVSFAPTFDDYAQILCHSPPNEQLTARDILLQWFTKNTNPQAFSIQELLGRRLQRSKEIVDSARTVLQQQAPLSIFRELSPVTALQLQVLSIILFACFFSSN